MLLVVIIVVLLIGNWFFTETLIFIPVDLAARLTSLGWWAIALLGIGLLAWCIGDD